MKTIGVFQLGQKKYDTIDIGGAWGKSIPRIAKNACITFLGDTGEGKTEGVMQFVKQLCLGRVKVDWVSYEQGHGYDLQLAVNRNRMIDVSDFFQVSDPHDKPADVSYFQDFYTKVTTRGSADFFVIDSSQFSEFEVDDFKILLTDKKCKKKGFIFISHKEPGGKLPIGILAKTIARLGHITVMVKNYIAEPVKNRFGGNEKYVIFEERARVKEPKYFAELDKQAKKDLFNTTQTTENTPEKEGVFANE